MEQASGLDLKGLVLPLTAKDPFAAAIRSTPLSMIVTDPRAHDNPIVFANDAFLTATGYLRDEVIGRNCRFLQGPGTEPLSIARIRDAIRRREAVSIDLLNYRKDGTSFWNGLYISPIFDADGRLEYFFATQLDVTARIERQNEVHLTELAQSKRNVELEKALETNKVLLREIDHRVKNSLQMVSSMLMLQAMSLPDPSVQQTLREMLERVDALGLAHKRLYELAQPTRFNLQDFVQEIAENVLGASGRKDIQLRLDLASVTIGADSAAALALVINEALTNAVKHGFKDGRAGVLSLTLTASDGRCRLEICDDGPGFAETDPGQKSFGTSLIETLARQLRATHEWAAANPGTRFAIDFPLD